MKPRLTLTILIMAGLAATQAYAACSTPAAPAGQVFFNSTTKTMQYCNGTNWVNTGVSVPGAAQTGCTTPTAAPGGVYYNGALGVIQFCNGENWVNTACPATRTPGGSGCTGGGPGAMRYEVTSNELQFCDSTNWTAMGWPCSPPVYLARLTGSDVWLQTDYAGADSLSYQSNTLVVGAIGKISETGAVYIFTGSGSNWTQQQKLTAPDGQPGDRFGRVAIDSDTLIVGADLDTDTYSRQGSAYIYVRSGSTWSLQQKIKPSDPGASLYFGQQVAIKGNMAIVASYGHGAAYIFKRSGSTWSQAQKLSESGTFYGSRIAWDSNTLVVGDIRKNTNTGAAYVYTYDGTTWTKQANINASDGTTEDYFSQALSLKGNILLVSAHNKANQTGAVYVYTRSGSTWTQTQKILASDAATNGYFGVSVSMNENADIALVAANGKNYTFKRSGGTWTQDKIFSPQTIGNDTVTCNYQATPYLLCAGVDKTTSNTSIYIFPKL